MSADHEHKYASNDAHLGATSGRDGETLSAGSTARNESNARMVDNNNALEKDFSRQDGKSHIISARIMVDSIRLSKRLRPSTPRGQY